MVNPTMYNTLGIEKSCLIRTFPRSDSFDAFVTIIPVDKDISNDGICETRPSPIVRIVYFDNASLISAPCTTTPSTIPPTRFIAVMIRPAVASPFTYFVAPSIAPKNVDSSCIFSRRLFASASSIAPVFKSASIAICLPGMASSVNLAVTSDTRSEPLLITIN